jgi:hypothetical protein
MRSFVVLVVAAGCGSPATTPRTTQPVVPRPVSTQATHVTTLEAFPAEEPTTPVLKALDPLDPRHPLRHRPRGWLPMVAFDDPTVTGALDMATVRKHVRRNRDRLRYCYEIELVTSVDAMLQGNVSISFTIEPDGRVTDSKATSPIAGMAPVATCVEGVLAALVFSKPADGRQVQVTSRITYRREGN